MILLQKKVPVLVEFHKKHVARKLVTRAIKNTQDKDQGEEDVELFCYCQTPYDDSKPYVGCDDVHCNYEWIHCMCAKVKKKQGKVSYGTANIAKEKIIAKMIKLLAPTLSKTFSETTLQILQEFYVALGIVTKACFCYEIDLRI